MESGRRSLMPLQESHPRSNLPLPSTAKKQQTRSRMSLAGPAIRAPQLAPPSTNPRQSMARSQNNNALLMSTSKQNMGRTPLNNSIRRGSIWGTGGMTAPSGSQSMKDTRPLRDKGYQSKTRLDISDYLLNNGYDIHPSALTSIQGKDYRLIFEFLTQRLDPYRKFNHDKFRFEDEFVPALKAIQYPFAHAIDNKWLAAPASMHSWPALLGVLQWLVEMCKLRDDYLNSQHPTLLDPAWVPEEFEDQWDHAALAFSFCEDTYHTWLEMTDDLTDPTQRFEDRYAKRNLRIQSEVEEQTVRLNDAKAQLKKVQASVPPIDQLVRDNGVLKRDTEKIQGNLQKYESRKKKLHDIIAIEGAELQRESLRLDEYEGEHKRLQDIVEAQNLSPQEVLEMKQAQETLSKTLQDLKQKIADTHKNIMALEVSVTNRVTAAEEALDQYTNLLSSLELFPPLQEPWSNIDLTLELNSAASNPQQLLIGADIRKVIKPTLSAIAESKRVERSDIETEHIKVDDELDQLSLECENVDEDTSEVEKKVAALNDQADDLRDVAQQEAQVASGEANRLERDLAAARTAALANGMSVKSRLQALQFDYQEQIAKVSRLKDETVRAIIKNSHEIAMFKEEVSRHLLELREFAGAE